MTYPPSNSPTPPSGAPGPWQQPYQQPGGQEGYPSHAETPGQPYGYPYGASQQPQQPYGAPQQPYGAPYGAPQPYGTPYGAPQQPYGYPTPQPAGGNNRMWLAIGGAVLAVVILVGGVLIFVLTGDSGSGGGNAAGSSQSAGSSGAEKEVRDFLDEVMASTSDLKGATRFFCQADRDLFDKIGGLDAIDIPKTTGSSGSAEITKITVTGNKAVVDVSSSAGPGKLYLRKESGSWKICMSDMPGMPSIP